MQFDVSNEKKHPTEWRIKNKCDGIIWDEIEVRKLWKRWNGNDKKVKTSKARNADDIIGRRLK